MKKNTNTTRKILIHTIRVIKTFGKIILKKENPLIICDIDNTLFYRDSTECKDITTDCCSFFTGANSCCCPQNITETNFPRIILPIDIEGFRKFEERVHERNGKIIFLSARGEQRRKTMYSDFKQIGLDAKNYEIHYTTKTFSKGKYLYEIVKPQIAKYGEIVFIDDIYDNHLSVFEYFPDSTQYLFLGSGIV
jgi:hypothetical protein